MQMYIFSGGYCTNFNNGLGSNAEATASGGGGSFWGGVKYFHFTFTPLGKILFGSGYLSGKGSFNFGMLTFNWGALFSSGSSAGWNNGSGASSYSNSSNNAGADILDFSVFDGEKLKMQGIDLKNLRLSNLKPLIIGSDVSFVGNLSYQITCKNGLSPRVDGYFITCDYYSDGGKIENYYNAQSGPWGYRVISSGEHIIYGGEMGMFGGEGYSRDGVRFYIDTHPNTSMEIHPDGGTPGTNGCIGIQENACELNEIYNFVNLRTRLFGSLILYVIY